MEARVVRVEHKDAHDVLRPRSDSRNFVDPGLVGAAGDVAPPCFVIEIPAHGLPKPAFEIHPAPAAEFGREFRRVDRVAMVVAGAVGDIGDQRARRAARSRRARWKTRRERRIVREGAVDGVADHADHVAVVALVAAADIVGLAGAAVFDDVDQGLAVVGDVQARTFAAAVDRQRLSSSA